jgi:hypothetical protein
VRRRVLTLEEAFNVVEFTCVVEFTEVFGLLGEVLPLRERVSLVRNEVRGHGIQLGDKRGEVDVWRTVSLCMQAPRRAGSTSPGADGLLELVALVGNMVGCLRLVRGGWWSDDSVVHVNAALHGSTAVVGGSYSRRVASGV